MTTKTIQNNRKATFQTLLRTGAAAATAIAFATIAPTGCSRLSSASTQAVREAPIEITEINVVKEVEAGKKFAETFVFDELTVHPKAKPMINPAKGTIYGVIVKYGKEYTYNIVSDYKDGIQFHSTRWQEMKIERAENEVKAACERKIKDIQKMEGGEKQNATYQGLALAGGGQ